MLRIQRTLMSKMLITILLVLSPVFCYPLGKLDDKLEKEEKHYPNGTIVGKYSYNDNDGNPIQVKYYADDGSYGVELKSIKMMSNSENPEMQNVKQNTFENILQGTENALGLSNEFYNPTNKTSEPFELLNKDAIHNLLKPDSKNPDYEIYFQNELKTPKKCGKDKVRVYFDKDKRKSRDTSNSLDDTVKFCSQF